MKRIHNFFVFVALLLSVSGAHAYEDTILGSVERRETTRSLPRKEMTFLVYMAADNDLNPFSKSDIAEMMRIGSNERINILVHLNTKYPGQKKISRKLYIDRGKVSQDGADEQRDSGDPRTLVDACEWAHTAYPSDKFVLVLWDHGSGALNRLLGAEAWECCSSWWQMCTLCPINRTKRIPDDTSEGDRAICYDFSTGNFFTDAKLRWALEQVCKNQRAGKKIDVLAFDACLMACIEVAHTVQPYADYMVSSQEVIPGDGYGYDKVLGALARTSLSPRDIASHLVAAFRAEYHSKIDDYTLSALDLSKLGALIQGVDDVSKWMGAMLSGQQAKSLKSLLEWASHPRSCTHFHEISYLDITHLLNNVSMHLGKIQVASEDQRHGLADAINQTHAAFRECVFANHVGKKHSKATGLSIYYPMRSIDPTYPGLIWSKDTQWHNFLRAYFAVRFMPEMEGEGAVEA